MTRRALVIGCGGTIGGAWAVAALAALCDETGWVPSDFDILQGTSAGAEMVTMLGGGASVDDLVAMHRGVATDARLGWMPPVTIGGRRYVDGGARSTASVDLIGADEADAVYVIAPMASEPGVRAPGVGGLIEQRLLRQPMSQTLQDEAAAVRSRGATVVTITPDGADLAGLGANFMDHRHRRAAFESSMTTAPVTVRRALAGVRS